jgi:hypothetical protein
LFVYLPDNDAIRAVYSRYQTKETEAVAYMCGGEQSGSAVEIQEYPQIIFLLHNQFVFNCLTINWNANVRRQKCPEAMFPERGGLWRRYDSEWRLRLLLFDFLN